jgi:flavin-dependent dehydrogenase
METDLCIAGGGIAGLSAGILATRMGYQVVLSERKTYPYHKVCGEYLSLEAIPLLESFGLRFPESRFPRIRKIVISSPGTRPFEAPLPLGAIGLSRYCLDAQMAEQFQKEGGHLIQGNKTLRIENLGPEAYQVELENGTIQARQVFCATGRNKPTWAGTERISNGQAGYTGIKIHLKSRFPDDSIGLHHFPGGYAGISAVEDGWHCMAYMVQDGLVRQFKGDLERVEQEVLWKNPIIRSHMEGAELRFPRLSTSGIHFGERNLHFQGMLHLGDGSGMIPPLAGNGMSMALHESVLACRQLPKLLGSQDQKMEGIRSYESEWKSAFSRRLWMAKLLQKAMDQPGMAALTIQSFRLFPFLFSQVARRTHGIRIPES